METACTRPIGSGRVYLEPKDWSRVSTVCAGDGDQRLGGRVEDDGLLVVFETLRLPGLGNEDVRIVGDCEWRSIRGFVLSVTDYTVSVKDAFSVVSV